MVRLYLVRHGRAAAGWGTEGDPGLDAIGREQAERLAASLAGTGPLPIITSPLRRTRETAAPLERLWRRMAAIEPAVAEIPSPVAELAARGEWLRQVMTRRWSDLPEMLQGWRRRLLQSLLAVETNSVIVTHFIAINVAVGHAIGEDAVVCFRPDNCSCTVIDSDQHILELLQRGTEAETKII